MSYEQDFMEDEGAGYLISVSDMMSGLLFIFIITLVAFIIHFQDASQKEIEAMMKQKKEALTLHEKIRQQSEDAAKQTKTLNDAIKQQQEITERQELIVEKLTSSNDMRTELLIALQKKLDAAKILVQIDAQHGVLRLTEKAIRFQSAKDTLDQTNLANLQIIGDVFSEVLPCYSSAPPSGHQCAGKINLKNQLDAVFVEGHTDNVPMSSRQYKDNWDLSAQRAIRTFRLLAPPRPLLNSMINTSGQPIFSVSGYGDGRPVQGHEYSEPTADAANRRIDLRFIMTPPSLVNAQKAVMEQGVR
ncbi:OmpA/MotB family protein [Neptunomonas qingdaonensis]|uniref:Flagellar motor protein MotB n=1 Tax=Neptunomonas qingdaonensis TaxID=1045558 RepID=A0A1I2QMX0_9GAMM|nr:OmpA family protein [Neptunomonas qingdaonensis]SFG29945.1 Flagellar motor protein MotB [Neptunomonas qingdaonensis]